MQEQVTPIVRAVVIFLCLALTHAGTIQSLDNTNNVVKYFDFNVYVPIIPALGVSDARPKLSIADASSNPTFVIQQTADVDSKVLYYLPETTHGEPEWVMTNMHDGSTIALDFTPHNANWTSCKLNIDTPTTWMDPTRMNFEHKPTGLIFFICTPKGSSRPHIFSTTLNSNNPTVTLFTQGTPGTYLHTPAKLVVFDDRIFTFNDGGKDLYFFDYDAPSGINFFSVSHPIHHMWRCGNRLYISTQFAGNGTMTECVVSATVGCTERQASTAAQILWISDMSPPCGSSSTCFMIAYKPEEEEKRLYLFRPGTYAGTEHLVPADFSATAPTNYLPLTGMIGHHGTENHIVFTKLETDYTQWTTSMNCDTTSSFNKTGKYFAGATNRIYIRGPGYTVMSDGASVGVIDPTNNLQLLASGTLIPFPYQNATTLIYGVRETGSGQLPRLFLIDAALEVNNFNVPIRHVTIDKFQMVDPGIYRMKASSSPGNCFFLASASLSLYHGIEPSYSCNNFSTVMPAGNFNQNKEPITTLLDDFSKPTYTPPQIIASTSSQSFDFVMNLNPEGAQRPQSLVLLTAHNATAYASTSFQTFRPDPSLRFGATYANESLFVRDGSMTFHSASRVAGFTGSNFNYPSSSSDSSSEAIYCAGLYFFTVEPYGAVYASPAKDFTVANYTYISKSSVISSDTPHFHCINDRYVIFQAMTPNAPSALVAWDGLNATSFTSVVVVNGSTECKLSIYEYKADTSLLLYGCQEPAMPQLWYSHTYLPGDAIPFGVIPTMFNETASKPGRFLAATTDVVFLENTSAHSCFVVGHARTPAGSSGTVNCIGTPVGIPGVGVVYLNPEYQMMIWRNDGLHQVAESNKNYLLTDRYLAIRDVLLVEVQSSTGPEVRTYVANLTTASSALLEDSVFDFELTDPLVAWDLSGRVGFMCAFSSAPHRPAELCFIESVPSVNSVGPTAPGTVVVTLPPQTDGDLFLNQTVTYILPSNGVVNGSVFVDTSTTLQLSTGTTISGDVETKAGSAIEIVGIATIAGSLNSDGTLVVNQNSSLNIGSNFTLGSGTLTFTTPLFSSVSSVGCVNTTGGAIEIDLAQVSGQGETLLLSGSSSCSAFGPASYLNSNGQCARTESRPGPEGSGLAQLFLVYSPASESGGCDGDPSAPTSTVDVPVVVGAVVGGVLGVAILIGALLLAIPGTRRKLLPFSNRAKEVMPR